jgi:hypothetical protein
LCRVKGDGDGDNNNEKQFQVAKRSEQKDDRLTQDRFKLVGPIGLNQSRSIKTDIKVSEIISFLDYYMIIALAPTS